MFTPPHRQAGKAKDDCWVCSAPVYEGDASVRYLGLWMHEACFRDANHSTDVPHGERDEEEDAA